MKLWIGRIAGFLVLCGGVYVQNEYDSLLGFILLGSIGLFIMRLGHPDMKGPFD